MAGLVCYYNTSHWYYLNVLGNDFGKPKMKFLQITACDNFAMTDLIENPIDISDWEKIYLKVKIDYEKLQFYYSQNEENWQRIGTTLDSSILSDDYVQHGGLQYRAAFTGAFVGICCQDLTGQKNYADFGWFEYVER